MIFDLTLKDDRGGEFNLSSLNGKWFVIYFYPKDDTPGCTIEAKDFTSKYREFKDLDTEVIGVSRDNYESHSKFKIKHNLSIILLSDPEGILHSRLNVRNRSTFLFDPSGKIVQEWRGVNPLGHASEVLEVVKRLKKDSTNKK
ncbi:MAG: peroxiredoxin [Candidatus Micrarchaeota archaeon]|nr:peroxiredoxin [Candidatus Micrarchaeota archaeon]MCX8154755.1 peroxiredoxin [Candidatus Micrarchaeota archaeon]